MTPKDGPLVPLIKRQKTLLWAPDALVFKTVNVSLSNSVVVVYLTVEKDVPDHRYSFVPRAIKAVALVMRMRRRDHFGNEKIGSGIDSSQACTGPFVRTALAEM